VWKARQVEAFTADELRTWFGRNPLYNVGVVCGLVSKIVMVDIDHERGEEHLRQLYRVEAYPTWTFRTSGGRNHYVYTWPWPDQPRGNPLRGLPPIGDFLGEGRYSVLPPSLHNSGACYAWTVGGWGSNVPIAEAPPALVVAVRTANAAHSKPGGGEVRAAAGLVAGGDLFRRALAWAAKREPAIQGQHGQDVAFGLACALVHGFGLSDAEAVAVMAGEWNARCQPPWSPAELHERVARARAKGHHAPILERPKGFGDRKEV
jgi:hypothetical protein